MPQLRNKRWEEYARLRAAGLSKTDAWYKAGYNANNRRNAGAYASQLEKRNPEVAARITELEREILENAAKRAEVDREWVLQCLKDNYEKAAADKEVLDRQGNPTGEYVFNASGANRAAELIGKELGMFVERFSVESLDSQIEGMSADELRAYVKSAATQVGLRVVEMTDDEKRQWIHDTAPSLGLRVVEARGQDSGSAAAEEAGGLQALSEASGVPPSRRH